MPSSLIQEQHITIPKSLAATLGLEQAIMLQVLAECLQHRSSHHEDGYNWITLASAEALKLMPFWSEQDIDRISQKLQEQGIIRLGGSGLMLARQLVIALNEASAPVAPSQHAAPTPQPTVNLAAKPRQGAQTIAASWQPGTEMLRKLQEFNGVPQEFALQLVPEFTTYWRDRQATTYSWESRFMAHVQRAWQQHTARQASAVTPEGRGDRPMDEHWQPSEDALTILVRSGIEQQFVMEAIPEFILYWRDRGRVTSTWDTIFIAHIRRQWGRYESSMQYDTEPRRIDNDWRPSAEVYDILRMANIDIAFAEQLIGEFVVYWRDSNQVYTSWNTRFLQHIKNQWARRLNGDGQGAQNYGQGHQSTTGPDRRGFVDKHTDQSWREDL